MILLRLLNHLACLINNELADILVQLPSIGFKNQNIIPLSVRP